MHAARRYQDERFAPTLVLVPTARHGDQFRRRLVARGGVALNLEVATLAQYARLHAAGRTLSREVAADLLRRVSLERIESGAAGRFEPIAGKPGLHALIGEAVSGAGGRGRSARRLRGGRGRHAESADLVALADIYAAYRRAAGRAWVARPRRGALAGRGSDRAGGPGTAGARARRLVRVPQPSRAGARRGPGRAHPRVSCHRPRGGRASELDGVEARSTGRRLEH